MASGSRTGPSLAGEAESRSGNTVLGRGWSEVSSFDEVEEDDYESGEEEYITLDLGPTFDIRSLQGDNQYQLIGLTTPTPFLKINNQIFRGSCASLVGVEIICGNVRSNQEPQNSSHPPFSKTSKRITFQPVNLHKPDPRAVPRSTVGPGSLPSSNAFTAKKKARGRKVLLDPEELDEFDLDAMGAHQHVELGPRVLRSLGIEPPSGDPAGGSSLGSGGVLLKKKEIERVLLGVPGTGRKGRPKKLDYFGD